MATGSALVYSRGSQPSARRAFTLVELLVVIGIIALLISILLPTLSVARKQAQSLVCMANMRSIGQALNIYVSEYRGYLPGPNTSGKSLNFGEWSAGVPAKWSDETAATDPTYNMDWVSPTLGQMLGLPTNRADRLVAIFQSKLRCPSNEVMYSAVFGTGWPEKYAGSGQIYTSSYSAVAGFHYWPADANGLVPNGYVGNPSETSDFRLPGNYAPKITSVGNASDKIYVVEGARYHNGTSEGFSFNPFFKQIRGGNLMITGPFTRLNGDPYYYDANSVPTVEGELYAFRHRKQMNAVFFDGHCESITGRDARRAVRYWPRGTTIPAAYTAFAP